MSPRQLLDSLVNLKVLVTGADGFIGSHLVEALVESAASVKAFCLYNSHGSLGWLDDMPADKLGSLEFCMGDVRDPGVVDAAVTGVDVVLHLAALIAIPYSYRAPQSYIETNVMGTLNVLEAVRRKDGVRMVHTSTSEVYGTPATVPITEGHPLRAQSPYSASKIAADKLCEAYASSYETPVLVLRPFNTFGPRQSIRAVIPAILSQLLSQRGTPLKLGDLEPKRDFTFVSDTVDGIVRAACLEFSPGETIQLGTGHAVSIRDVVDVCVAVIGTAPEVTVDPERIRPANSEVRVLLSDPTRARELLGWSPKVDLKTGIALTADWMVRRLSQGGLRPYLDERRIW